MRKALRKMMALVIAMVMVLAMNVSVFAGGTDPEPGTSTVPDKTIQLTGLQESDTVSYVNVIRWNTTNAGWEWNTDVVDTGEGKLTADDLAAVVGNPDTDTDGEITPAMAAKIAANIKSTASWASDGTNTDGTWNSPSTLAIGLYVAQAVPTTAGIVYNPVFLGVNPPQGGGSTADISTLNYAPDGAAKKQTTDITKTAKDKNGNYVHATDENVGDEIEFKIETTLPVFMANYKNPFFKVSDAMSDGLKFVDGSLEMKIGTGTAEAPTDNKWQQGDPATDIATFHKTDAQNWDVTFDSAYLKTVTTPTTVEITYKAIITDAAASVNPETNEGTIEYSRNPNNDQDHGTDTDDTKHYTFGLDIGMQGNEEYTTSEFVKVGKDKNGNYITEEKTGYSNKTSQHPLEGARFLLYAGSGDSKTLYTNGTPKGTTPETYDDQTIVNGAPVGAEYFSTDNWGRFPISGLEAGTYTLVETKAPAGYKKAADTVIVIAATYDAETKNLTGYTVTIGGIEAASYTIDAGTAVVEKNPETTEDAGDSNTQEIVDTQGVELPSTGGIGTTLFYLIGTILVLGAGILLVTRRRMKAN